MKILKILLSFSFLILLSCNNRTYKDFEPEILDSDRIVNCYTNNLYGEEPAYVGNLLLSQNGIPKAFQLNKEKPQWLKVISFEYRKDYPYYKAGNQYYNNCIDLVLEDERGWVTHNRWICYND